MTVQNSAKTPLQSVWLDTPLQNKLHSVNALQVTLLGYFTYKILSYDLRKHQQAVIGYITSNVNAKIEFL